MRRRLHLTLRAYVHLAILILAGCLAALTPARADHQPVIVVPGNWQVPVIVNGIDASYHVVTGDWGLYAPGGVAPRVLGPAIIVAPIRRGYFPASGRPPRQGRREIQHSRRPRAEPESFYRSWSAKSGFQTETGYPAYDPPPVIRAPGFDREEFSPRPPD